MSGVGFGLRFGLGSVLGLRNGVCLFCLLCISVFVCDWWCGQWRGLQPGPIYLVQFVQCELIIKLQLYKLYSKFTVNL